MIEESVTDQLEAGVLTGHLQSRTQLSKACTKLLSDLHAKLAQLRGFAEEIRTLDSYIKKRVPDYALLMDPALGPRINAGGDDEPFIPPQARTVIFANMPISQAAERYLQEKRTPQTIRQIAWALIEGGANLKKTNNRPLANLKASISYRNARYQPPLFTVENEKIGLIAWRKKSNKP